MSVANAKIPASVGIGILGLIVGLIGGIAIAVYADIRLTKAGGEGSDEAANTKEGGEAPAQKGMKGGSKGGPPGGGGGKGGGGGGGKGPNSKTQLTQLVTKLDYLTHKSLAIDLTTDQKLKVKEILAGLDSKEDLSEEDAKSKLDALLHVVEGQKDTLEKAGFRWPGQGGGGFGGGGGGGGPPTNAPANPFKAPEAGDRLKSLQSSLGS